MKLCEQSITASSSILQICAAYTIMLGVKLHFKMTSIKDDGDDSYWNTLRSNIKLFGTYR